MSAAQATGAGGMALADAFDQDVLSEIEKRLGTSSSSSPPPGAGDKVELDRADLPLEDFFPSGAEEDEDSGMEVDLSEEEWAEEPGLDEDLAQEKPRFNMKKVAAAAGLLLVVLLALGMGLWFGRTEEEKAPESLPPWMFKGQVPDAEKALSVALEPFIVPIPRSAEGRILHAAVSLEMVDPESRGLLNEKSVALRDVIYTMLRDKPAAELNRGRASRTLQSRLKAELNQVLGSNVIYRVFFTQFVITG